MTLEKKLLLQRYVDMLKQRLSGQLSPEMREVIEIDLKKTLAKIAKAG